MLDAFLRRRDAMHADLSKVPGIDLNMPMGAFYLFPDISKLFGLSYKGKTLKNSDDVAMYFIEEAHVATVSGAAFGTPECIRISYAAADEVLAEAVRRIDVAVRKLS